MLFILLSLLILPCSAKTESLSVGVHTDAKSNLAVTLGEYSLYTQKSSRYGGGGGRFQIGNQIGLHLQSNSGWILVGLDQEEKNILAPMFGLEGLNGEISLNSSTTIQDYYQGFAGASTGIQMDIMECRILPLIRGGVTVGTLGRNGLIPEGDLGYGPALHVGCKPIYFSYGGIYNYFSRKNVSTSALEVKCNDNDPVVGLEVEQVNGIKEETTFLVFIKNLF